MQNANEIAKLKAQVTILSDALSLAQEAIAVSKRKGWVEYSVLDDIRKAFKDVKTLNKGLGK